MNITPIDDPNSSRPHIEETLRFERKGHNLVRFDCRRCGNCALVYQVDVDTANTAAIRPQLEMGQFCAQAAEATIELIEHLPVDSQAQTA